MTYVPYSYKHPSARRYVFISIGKKRIEKVVDFTPLKAKNTMNLSFGDLMADGSINYKANSNNGDILKVLATERTRLYARILKTYYALFSKDFIIVVIESRIAAKDTFCPEKVARVNKILSNTKNLDSVIGK